MKTPIQEAIEILNREIELQKPLMPTNLSARDWFSALGWAVGVLTTHTIPKEREVIEKSFMAGYISDNINGPVSGEDFFNKQFGQ